MNFQTTGGALRIAKTRLKDGSINLTFSLVRNCRINGRPTHITLAKVLTVRESELKARAVELYKILDEKVAELTKAGTLWSQDQSKIENQISKVVARPAAIVTKAVKVPESNDYNILKKMIAEVGEKAERKLTERGV